MIERLCRLIVVACVALAVVAAGLVIGEPARAATAVSVPTTDAVMIAADAAAPTSGIHRVWISVDSITTSTADDTVPVPTDRASAAAFVSQLNAYWNRETGGAVTIQLGGFEVRALTSACSVSSLFIAGRTLDFGGRFANTADWAGTNDHLLAMSRESCSSASVGQGSVGGGGGIMSTVVGSSGSVALAVAAHEFGHNLGFLHANVDSCPTGTDSGPTCATTAYADYLDVMGGAVSGSLPHESTPQLISLGYLTDYASLSQATGVVQQTLMPVGAASGTRSLRITDPTTGEQYYVEYRVADAQDGTSPEFASALSCTTAANGLTRCWGGMSKTLGGIRVLRVGTDGTSVLAVGTYGSTHLDAGQSFENHDGAFKVTVTSLSPTSGAVLTVAFGSSITAAAAVVATPTATVSTTAVAPTSTVAYAPAAASALRASTPVVTSSTEVDARLRHATIRRGTRPVVVAVVTGASRPTGKLTVWANGQRMRTVALRATDAGVRAITLPRRPASGKVTIRVTYSGSRHLAAATSGMKRLVVR